MDDFDILLKEMAKKEKENLPASLETRIEKTLNNLPLKKRGIRRSMLAAIIAAAFLVMPVMTVYGKEIPMVNTVIEFFKVNQTLRYGSDAEVYKRYSTGMGKTVTNNGVSITIENIACDDNFLVLFYTVKGVGKKIYKIIDIDVEKDERKVYEVARNLSGRIKINGRDKGISYNDNDDAYLTEDGKIKGMIRADISGQDLPNQLNIDFLVNEALGKNGQWNFNFNISKEEALKESKVVRVKKDGYVKCPGSEHNFKVEKVSFTPFGDQITISENLKRSNEFEDNPTPFNWFVLYDDKGNSLDVLRLRGGNFSNGIKTENSFEFVKGNRDSKFLTLVPVYIYFDNTVSKINNIPVDINKFPLELKMSDKGSLVVEKIEFREMETKIYYTKKGVVLHDGALSLLDDKGMKIEKSPVFRRGDYVVDREKGLYVRILPKLDESKKYKLSFLTDPKFELLDQYEVEIPLK